MNRQSQFMKCLVISNPANRILMELVQLIRRLDFNYTVCKNYFDAAGVLASDPFSGTWMIILSMEEIAEEGLGFIKSCLFDKPFCQICIIEQGTTHNKRILQMVDLGCNVYHNPRDFIQTLTKTIADNQNTNANQHSVKNNYSINTKDYTLSPDEVDALLRTP